MPLIADPSHLHLLLTGPVYNIPEPEPLPVTVFPEPPQAIKSTPAIPSPLPPIEVRPVPVAPALPKVTAPEPPPPRRRSKVMVLYNEQTTPYLQPKHETLLKNILKAIGLTLEDIELVNLNNIKRVDYVEILKEKTLNQLISFGIDLRELEINIPLTAYRVQKIEEINMLLADSFHELELNTDKKRMLWTCLKAMFQK
jgi:DNA polymerase III psi subunit